MTVGEKIQKFRKEKGITQKELGEMLDLAEITIRQYETNKREPKIAMLRRIAKILDVKMDAFLDLDLGSGNELARSTMEANALLENIPKMGQETAKWKERILIEQFHQLNDEGQTAAVEAVENLTYNPRFQK